MKKSLLVFPAFSLLSFVLVSFGFIHHGEINPPPRIASTGFAVAELYTSEGCSSCPPADEAVADIKKKYANVYVLGFHVDYWNYLGWKDEFSAASYSQRQSRYAEVFNLNSIYTPQVVINGKIQFTGSDRSQLQKTIEAALKSDGANAISELNAKGNDSRNIVVDCKATVAASEILNLALVQLSAVSAVKRGENQGKRLEHINVVRDFKTFTSVPGPVTFSLPAGLSLKECRIIAFTQSKTDLHVTGAADCIIQ